MFKKFAFICSILLFISFSSQLGYAQINDISGHWAEKEINKWISKGILNGTSDGLFRPDAPITRAQFAALANRIFNYTEKSDRKFTDVKGDEWFADDIAKAVAAGIVEGYGDGSIKPDQAISRQEAAVLLYRVFNLKVYDRNAADRFKDTAQIAEWSRDAVSCMTDNGYISGRGDSSFVPGDKITRAEAVKLIDNIANDLMNTTGVYSGTAAGNAVVNTSGVVLKDMTVEGDLYITQGVGSGDVTLDNVTVKGQTFVMGGGEHSIVINNSSLAKTLVVDKKDGKIRILAKGNTDIPGVQLKSGAILEEEDGAGKGFGGVSAIDAIMPGQEVRLDGDFDSVIIEVPGVSIQVLDGAVGRLELKEGAVDSCVKLVSGIINEFSVKEKADIQLTGGKVNNLVIEKNAAGCGIETGEASSIGVLTANEGVTVKGQGKITTANINSNNVIIEKKPDTINIVEGITASIAGQDFKKTAAPPQPAVPAGSTGGGSSKASAPEIISAKAKISGSNISAVYEDDEWVVDLSGFERDNLLTDITIKASNADSAECHSYTVNFTDGEAEINVHDLLGRLDTGEPGVSIASIKQYRMDTFEITIKGSGGSADITVRLKI